LNVAGLPATITDINVKLSITHPNDQDLDVFLFSPTGTKVELFTDVGSSGNDFTNTVLDDQAATSIDIGTAPFTGSFQPEGLLSDFNGQNPNGTWTLQITDDKSTNTGTLSSWSITVFSAENKTVSNSSGNYVLSGLSAGSHTIRRVLQGAHVSTSPPGGAYLENVVNGQAYTGRDFGSSDTPNPSFTVTIDQAVGQLDPSNASTIHFKAVFGKSVGDFTNGDVVLGGSALPTTAVVTGSGTDYDIAITGMSKTGYVTVTIPAGVATNGTSQNSASTNLDNAVYYDGTAPTVVLAKLPNITTPNSNSYDFDMTLTDDTSVDVSSLNSGDFHVTGPNGFDVSATFIGADDFTNGTPRIATFSIDAPAGGWTAAYNGTYSVVLQTGAIADTIGNTAVPGPLGTFKVNIAGATPTVTIDQAVGQADPTNGSPIHFAVVFSASVSDFVSSDVVVGGTAGATTALVIGSGTTYDVAVSGMTQTGTVTINIPAGVATSGGVGNQAATIIDNSVRYDATAPGSAIGTLVNISISSSAAYTFDVTFSDDTAVSVISIQSGDVRVTGPNSFDMPATLVSVDNPADGSPRIATFKFNPPGSGWTIGDNGTYTVLLQNGAIADTAGNTTKGAALGSFNVAIAPTVSNFKVHDGSNQRSLVKSLTVTFNGVVTLPSNMADAFTLFRTGPGTPNANVGLSVDTSLSTPTQTIAKITFTGALTEFGSLIDGRYDFTINSSQVNAGGVLLDGDNNGTAGGNYVTNLHRLFGDADGNATVNSNDFAALRSFFGLSGPSPFDFNNDNLTNSDDFAEFRKRFGITLP
jgi:subtilisin-like proprotein convertase family protein